MSGIRGGGDDGAQGPPRPTPLLVFGELPAHAPRQCGNIAAIRSVSSRRPPLSTPARSPQKVGSLIFSHYRLVPAGANLNQR